MPSAAHRITRRASTEPETVTGVSEMIISTATIAATRHADSHFWWNKAAHTSGIRITTPTPEVVPAARMSARTDPV